MNIIHGNPPNFEKLAVVFPEIKSTTETIFSYGDRMYYQGTAQLPREKIIHEETHGKRQLKMGIEKWWDQYMLDIKFRIDEEIIAYRAEYEYFCSHIFDRHQRFQYLSDIANDLSGPLYGNVLSKVAAYLSVAPHG